MSQTFDVVICGAGSIGVAAAYYLTQQGINHILLVDQHHPLSQTSAKSGENIRNWWPQQTMVDFTNRSLDLMEGLAEESGNVFNLTRRGYAYVSARPSQAFEPGLSGYSQQDVGPIRWHDDNLAPNYAPIADDFKDQPSGADILRHPALIQRTFPHFSDTIQTVIHARRCGAVSAQQLGMYLLKGAKQRGAQEMRGEVVALKQDSQGVAAVEVQTARGLERIETRCFINAAGPFAPHLAQMLDIELPIFNVLQQKIALQDPLKIVPRHMPFTIFLDPQYLIWSAEEREMLQAEPGYAWLLAEFPGGLHLKPEGGDDSTWLKLGWAFNQQPESPLWQPKRLPEFVDIVLRGAATLVPGLSQYIDNVVKPVPHYGGYYTKTKENLPLIGPLPVTGTYLAGAFSGFGTMTSCAAGELIAAWVVGAELPSYAPALSLARYEDADFMASLAAGGEL